MPRGLWYDRCLVPFGHAFGYGLHRCYCAAGVIVNNGIVMVDPINQQREVNYLWKSLSAMERQKGAGVDDQPYNHPDWYPWPWGSAKVEIERPWP